MAQVNVTISGKTYRMACDDGEEQHLLALGERLNQSIEQLRGRFGEIGDQRLTVMAAITLADQHAEAEKRLAAAQADIVGLEEARTDVLNRHETASFDIAESLVAVAERLEKIAARVNGLNVASPVDVEPENETGDDAGSAEETEEDDEKETVAQPDDDDDNGDADEASGEDDDEDESGDDEEDDTDDDDED